MYLPLVLAQLDSEICSVCQVRGFESANPHEHFYATETKDLRVDIAGTDRRCPTCQGLTCGTEDARNSGGIDQKPYRGMPIFRCSAAREACSMMCDSNDSQPEWMLLK